jgi:hypothetical protein
MTIEPSRSFGLLLNRDGVACQRDGRGLPRPERGTGSAGRGAAQRCRLPALIYQHATRDRDQAIADALGGLVRQVRSGEDAPA